MLDAIVQGGLAIVLALMIFILKQLSNSIKENRIDLKEHIKEDTRRFEVFQGTLTDIQVSIARNGKGN